MLGVDVRGQPRLPYYSQGVSPKHHSAHGRVVHLCSGFVDRAVFKSPGVYKLSHKNARAHTYLGSVNF